MGNATITNSKIYAKSNKNCIVSDEFEDNSQTLTINGKTLISNVEDTTNSSGVISWKSPGQITINKDVTIDGMVGLNIYPNKEGHSANVNITGASISTKQTAISIKGGDGTLKLQDAKVIAGNGNALNCAGSYSVEIYDSNLENTGKGYGIKMLNSSGLVVERSTFKSDKDYALSIQTSTPIPIQILDSHLYGWTGPISAMDGVNVDITVLGDSFLCTTDLTNSGRAYVGSNASLHVQGNSVLIGKVYTYGILDFSDNSSLYNWGERGRYLRVELWEI